MVYRSQGESTCARKGRLVCGAVLLAALASGAGAADIELAAKGRPLAVIRLAADAIPAEVTAARELARYLGRTSGARFQIVGKGEQTEASSIEVGATVRAVDLDPFIGELGPEEWVIRTQKGRLFLYGGRPRGTLYAVYRFLEDHIGVRWWSPFEEFVPRRRSLRLRIDRVRGAPAFVYRDIHGVDGPRPFNARNRVNGDFSGLGPAHGGKESYGPPGHVHNFHTFAPPAEFFASHPEYFSEIAGFRVGNKTQLCLTNEELFRVVQPRLEAYIEQAYRDAELRGESPPRIFAFSQMDWGRGCTCESCSRLVDQQGGQSGPLLSFVNRLAASIAERYPDVLIDTLAYHYTFSPPKEIRAAANVTVRLTALQYRDFAKPITHPDNRRVLSALEGWSEKVEHLRFWSYPVIFGDHGELPLPNTRVLAEDFRLYHQQGVEGVFIEHAYPIGADMRDLKVWITAKLLEDPQRSLHDLMLDFTGGYYGRAGREIRRYRTLLETAVARAPSTIRFRASPEAYRYLDRDVIVQAQRTFDRAERRVAGDPLLLRRVRHARLALDRVTLLKWPELVATDDLPFERATVIERYRETWYTQIALRTPQHRQSGARAAVEDEIKRLNSEAGPNAP